MRLVPPRGSKRNIESLKKYKILENLAGEILIRKGYLLVGNNSYYIAEKYLEPKDIAIVDAFYLVAITDSISEEERKKLLIEAINIGLETVPVEIEVPEKYSYTRYGFQLDPIMIQIRKDIMPPGATKELGSSEH